jgi:predicted alpha/beta hydrolase
MRPPTSKYSELVMQKITIIASDGYALSALYGESMVEAKGTVVISSATCIKKEFYINFAQFLIQNGYSVLLYDYRGIGGSAPTDIKNSTIYMHEWGTKDMNAVLDYMVDEKRQTGIIWLGHSIGAQLVGFLKNHQHIKKVVSVSAALGYWGYFPLPMRAVVWLMWYVISPVLITIFGYGTMRKVGWGEDLPKNAILEWRQWCMSKTYYMDFIREELKLDRFYEFRVPITALYISDDYIANDKTVPLMMEFFPNSLTEIHKINVKKYTHDKVGHTGIFRKKFAATLWPLLLKTVQ